MLFTGGFDRPVAVAQSGPIQFATYNEPTGVHLMLAHGGDVLVQWTTRDSARPLVQFARSDSHGQSDAAPSEAAASNASYVAEDMCGGAAAGRGWIHPGQLHTARMAGLEPGMRYRFRVGDPDLPDAPWSAWREFLAPPATGPDAHVHMVAFADVGTDEADGSNQASSHAVVEAEAVHGGCSCTDTLSHSQTPHAPPLRPVGPAGAGMGPLFPRCAKRGLCHPGRLPWGLVCALGAGAKRGGGVRAQGGSAGCDGGGRC